MSVRKVFLFLSTCVCFALTSCDLFEPESNTPPEEGMIAAPELSSSINYKEAQKIIEEAGFTNISCKGEVGTFWGIFADEDEVDYVTYGGEERSTSNKWFYPDVEVIIYYYTTNDSPNKPQEYENYTEDDYKSLCEQIVSEYTLYYKDSWDHGADYYCFNFVRNTCTFLEVSWGRSGRTKNYKIDTYDIVGDLENGWTIKKPDLKYWSYTYNKETSKVTEHYEHDSYTDDREKSCSMMDGIDFLLENGMKAYSTYESLYKYGLSVN